MTFRWGILLALCSCTPVLEPVTTRDPQADDPTEDSRPGQEIPRGRVSSESSKALAAIAEECEEIGETACLTHASREVAICVGGEWSSAPTCRPDERCDSARGSCVPIDPKCVGESPEAAFCVETERFVCGVDLVTVDPYPCRTTEVCIGKPAECVCPPNASRNTDGECTAVVSCDAAGGGCDPLTECRGLGSAAQCTPCPEGYTGTGEAGCVPELQSLEIGCVASEWKPSLAPDFSMGTYEYVTAVPLICPEIVMRTIVGPGVRVEVNGAASATESLVPLAIGRNMLKLEVRSEYGKSRVYALQVDRAQGSEVVLRAQNADRGDAFGYNVAAEGAVVVVGAPFEDGGGAPESNAMEGSGAAYVYERGDDGWQQVAYLKAPQPSSGEFFGVHVAISGDRILVGAPRFDPLAFGLLTPTVSGHAYLFRRAGQSWTHETTLAAPEISANMFGWSLDLDGDTAVVGAPYADGGYGAAYVYTFEGGSWSAGEVLVPAERVADARFGVSTALDGERLAVGAMHEAVAGMEAAGAVYLYGGAGSAWAEQQRLQSPAPKPLATYGMYLAVQGLALVISEPGLDLRQRRTPPGAVHAYTYPVDGRAALLHSTTATVPRSGDLYGSSVAIIGNAIAVGANGDSSAARGIDASPVSDELHMCGAAYLLAGGEKSTAYLKASDAEAEQAYGHSVAFAGDALVVGAPFPATAVLSSVSASPNGTGVVYVYE